VTVSGPGTAGQDPSSSEERKLRRREILYIRWGLLVALVSTVIAAYAAIQGRDAASIAARGIEQVEQQISEDRLATAIASIGGDQPAERAGGYFLLSRHIEFVLPNADSTEERRDAYNQYLTALELLENNLRNPPDAATETADESAGLGYGDPRIPDDIRYAANGLRPLMRLKPEVVRLRSSLEVKTPAPTVDLTDVQLYRQSWRGIDFAWLGDPVFRGIDLRGADLRDSIWGGSDLMGAHLQCADLQDASLQGARVWFADLRGANLDGADFTDAVIDGVKFDGAIITERTEGLPETLRPKPSPWNVGVTTDTCLRHYQAEQPATGAAAKARGRG
jgi:uncharacterized protein YjbI with pentapeptide repeats